jgi:hypothetical protein
MFPKGAKLDHMTDPSAYQWFLLLSSGYCCFGWRDCCYWDEIAEAGTVGEIMGRQAVCSGSGAAWGFQLHREVPERSGDLFPYSSGLLGTVRVTRRKSSSLGTGATRMLNSNSVRSLPKQRTAVPRRNLSGL